MANDGNGFSGLTTMVPRSVDVEVFHVTSENVEACLAWVASHGGETMIDPNDSVALFFVGFGKQDWQPVYDDEWLGVNSSGDFFEVIPSKHTHWFHPQQKT